MPLLVITIPWNPNIITIGGFILTWHGLFTAVGILAGVQLSLRLARFVHYDPDEAYTLALIGVPSGIIGARALFIAEHWDYYHSAIGEIIALNEGGISVWGAVLGGVFGAWLFARWRHYPVARGLDIAAAGLVLGLAIGRIGDLINGEHLGRPTNVPWAVLYTNPQSPAFAHSITVGPQHPATTYEMFSLLALLGIIFWLIRGPFRERPALTFFAFLDGYAILRFCFTYLRVDSDVVAFGLRTPQFIAAIVLPLSIPFIWYYATRPRQPFESRPTAPPAASQSPSGRVAVRRRS